MAHDLTGPIPADTVRISVRYGDWLYVSDIPADSIMEAVEELEDFAGETMGLSRARGTWPGVEKASTLASFAVREGIIEALTIAAMWMFLYRPDGESAEKFLAELVERDGGAWLVAATDGNGIEWAFALSPVELSRHGEAGDPPRFPGAGITLH